MNKFPREDQFTASSRRLHIGGKQRRDGWEVLNAQPGPCVDHLGNANDLSRFEDNTFGIIYASHVVEHFDHRNELQDVLAEWRRVLKPDGVLMVSVPDLEILATMILNKQLSRNERHFAMLIIFGGHVDKYDYHHVGLTEEFLRDYLSKAGFVEIERVKSFGLFQDSSEQKHAGQCISLNMRARKPHEQLPNGDVDAGLAYKRGSALLGSRRYHEALDCFNRVLGIKPNHAGALSGRGFIFSHMRSFKEALDSYDQVLSIIPDDVPALANRGNVLRELGRHEDAVADFDRALELQPDYIVALYNRGLAFLDLKRFEEAITDYDKMLALKSDYSAAALNKRGLALSGLGRHDEALESYNRALVIKPDYPEALINRGNVLVELKCDEEALISRDRASAIEHNYPSAFANRLQNKSKICDWDGLEAMHQELAERIDAGQVVIGPLLESPLGLPYRLKAARNYIQERFPPQATLPQIGIRAPHQKIRLGYFSPDFRQHPVAYMTAELFERHDRSRFEVTAFSLAPSPEDAIRVRLEAAFDRFINVRREQSDHEVALLARQLEIDIAIDLSGLIGVGYGGRPGIFALRAAPVQVSYLGYPNTMGADYIDYLIADHTVIPEKHRQYYSEKIAYLPHSFMCNDTHKEISGKLFSRQELGLPETGFVYCACHSNKKISPDVFDVWMRLLANVPGSVLWLFIVNPQAAENLKTEAAKRGIDPQRLIFAARTESLADHLARLRQANLFLDTFYWNAHSTSSEALWAGLPVLTLLGETFAGRVAASLLGAIGLPELVAHTREEYEALALTLAADSHRLADIKDRLAKNRSTHPLFDMAHFTRYIEAAYAAMWGRYQAGLSPEYIDVRE